MTDEYINEFGIVDEKAIIEFIRTKPLRNYDSCFIRSCLYPYQLDFLSEALGFNISDLLRHNHEQIVLKRRHKKLNKPKYKRM